MSPGSTRTGGVLEDMVLPALRHGGYKCKVQEKVGLRLGLGAHKVDVVATREGRSILVSVKWQQVSGTAEQKVPFEIICMLHAMDSAPGTFAKAYVVLGGEGWKLRGFYTSAVWPATSTTPSASRSSPWRASSARANQGKL